MSDFTVFTDKQLRDVKKECYNEMLKLLNSMIVDYEKLITPDRYSTGAYHRTLTIKRIMENKVNENNHTLK